MKEISGSAKKSFVLCSRRGSTLPVAAMVMLLFMILCVGMLALSGMNMSHVTFFERRNVLEQATLSLAQALADEIVENSRVWWISAPAAMGTGVLVVDSGLEPNVPKMKFTYSVSPDQSPSYALFVRGEYEGLSKGAIWGVSVDIYPEAAKKLSIRWSKPLQLDG
ncbi:MAG: hypothetical protein LBJ22_06020 [Synergistaceae bacterium]|nr:hypothetical protein [Synergistaceae bacterium]